MRSTDINGAIIGTGSKIEVSEITLKMSAKDAWALCNLLYVKNLEQHKYGYLEKDQVEAMKRVGRDIGILIDHPTRNNLGEFNFTFKPLAVES